MPIKDYKNSDEILKSKTPTTGEWIKSADKSLLELQFETKNVKFGESKTDQVELHVYDLAGNKLASNHDVEDWKKSKPELDGTTPEPRVFLDPHKNLRDLGFKRGEYKFVYNLIRPLVSKYNSQQQIFLKEIKANKKELILATNIVENGNKDIDEQYDKLLANIDKFFNIQKRFNDVKTNFDSTQLKTITSTDNKALSDKLDNIRGITDITIIQKDIDRDVYLQKLVDDTINLRSNTFQHPDNNILKNFNSDEELLYYYIHEMPNEKMASLREEVYTTKVNGKVVNVPTGIDNEVNITVTDNVELIKSKNAELKEIIKKFLTDEDYKHLTDVDRDVIRTHIIKVSKLRKTPYDQWIGDGLSDNIINKLTTKITSLIDINEKKIEGLEIKKIALGDDEASNGKATKEIDENIQKYKNIIRDLRQIEQAYQSRFTNISNEELEELLEESRDAIRDKITENTVELTNDDFEYIVQPQDGYFEFFELNFTNNVILKVINIARISDNEIAVKLYDDIPNTIVEKQLCWVQKYIMQPYIDNIILIPESDSGIDNTLRGPNFIIETNDLDSKETDFQSWNELLGTNANTSQQVIDSYFSGSGMGDVKLNINYCEFENFVHFGSAVERVKNFHYKMELIEFYDARLNTLNSASLSGSVVTNVTDTITKRNSVISGFDDFENFLYFSSGSQELSTFTSCSVDPWPKDGDPVSAPPLTWLEAQQQWVNTNILWSQGATTTLSGPNELPYEQLSTSNVASITWYQNTLNLASDYDRENPHALYRTIPDHIRQDSDNDQYELFVNMVAQHFDIMWTYINQMTAVHSHEENPKEGISDDLIYDVAKSMGWNLANGNYDAKLWEYTLGTDESGATQTSGSFMTSKSKEQTTKEIWRRQLNNLPYLLKTKGTERSVRALVACYGVPQSILTVREYGGPSKQNKRPTYNKTQFDYAVNLNGGRHIKTEWAPVASTGSSYTYPDALTLRFKTHLDDKDEFNYGVYGKHTLFQVGSGSDTQFFVELEPTSSRGQANVHFYLSGSGGYATASILDECIFDDDFTSILIQRNVETDNDAVDNNYSFFVKKQKWGKLTINASASLPLDIPTSGSYNDSWTTSGSMYLGLGDNPSNTTYFTGSAQELRYWTVPLDEVIFNNHVTSVGSYNSNTATGSFNDLQTRFNLTNKIDISATAYISSSHPDQTHQTFENGDQMVATFEGNWTTDNWYAFDETQYIEGPSLGGNNLYSDKIRIEDSSLRGGLSPSARQEVSAFDSAPLDSKRLGVYFSPQSIINDDIFRQMGFFEIDDYIGSPADFYSPSYPELKDISQEYWKKYANKNDVAEYIRLFSVYDFTMFQQIKQLLPARSNAITGLVIEPNILERNKVVTAPRIIKKELDYDVLLDDNDPVLVGEETTHKGDIEKTDDTLSGTKNDYEGTVEGSEVVIESEKTDYKALIDDSIVQLESEKTDYVSVIDMEYDNLPVQEDKNETFTTDATTNETTTVTDFDYHNTKGVIDLPDEEIIEGTVSNEDSLIQWKDFSKGTVYCHEYLLIDPTAPYTSPIVNTGNRYPQQVSQSVDVSLIDWSDTDNLIGNTGNYTNSQLEFPTVGSEKLIISDLGINLSETATIKGIEVTLYKQIRQIGGTSGTIQDAEVKLTLTGPTGSAVGVGNDKSSLDNWSEASPEYTTYGGPSDTWGLTLTRNDIVSSSFGLSLQATGSGTGGDITQARVLTAGFKIYYTVDTIQSTGSTPPWECQPTESYIGNSREYGDAIIDGYWVHEETDWTIPTSGSTYSSSATDWNIPSGGLFPVTSSGTNQVTYTSVFSNYGFNIDEAPTYFNAPYNSVVRGLVTRVNRQAAVNDGDYVVDKSITIGTSLTSHTGTNLSSSNSHNDTTEDFPNTTGTSGSIGEAQWVNNHNVTNSLLTFAAATTSSLGAGDTEWLVSGGYGFDIPDHATINGIEVSFRRTAEYIGSTHSRVSGSRMSLTKTSGSVTPFVGTVHSSSVGNLNWSVTAVLDPRTYVTETFGSSTDTWGTTWIPSDINSSDFGTYFKCYLEATTTATVSALVQWFNVKVYYTYLGWETSATQVVYGTNSDKWGQSFTLSDINSNNFNFKVQATISGSNTATINNVETKVFYSYYVTGSNSQVQEYLPLGIENHRYNGCKVTSPDFNEPSKDTSDKGPVVETTAANPNGLILRRKTATRGNLEIGESPIKLRNRS